MGLAYFASIAFVYAWAFLAGGKDLTFFKYIGGMKQRISTAF